MATRRKIGRRVRPSKASKILVCNTTECVACPHRAMSACDDCEDANPEICDVGGAQYWVPDPAQRKLFRSSADKAFESNPALGVYSLRRAYRAPLRRVGVDVSNMEGATILLAVANLPEGA